MTIGNLNAAITNHDYGYTEVSDKPCPLRETVFSGTERYKLKYKAAQARLFLKLLPFYLGSFVHKENDFFFLLTNLQQIVQIIYSPVITSITIEELRTLISDHLSLFKQLFPESNILPKQHYMIHIPSMIEMFGPMIRSSCFSFESAHNYFKTLAQKQNFKNLPLSLARRQQLRECSFFGDTDENPSSHPLFSTECKHGVAGNIREEMVEQLGHLFEKFCLLPGIKLTVHNIQRLSWIIIYGTKFRKGGIIALDAIPETKMPVFGNIEKVWIVCGFVYFEVKKIHTIRFDEHYQAYYIKELTEQNSFICSYESLLDYNVFHFKLAEGKTFVPVKYYIEDLIQEHLNETSPLHR